MSLLKSIKGLIKYSWLLQELIVRDLKIKYRRSVLGYLWSVLNPLMMMTILTIVFSNMFRFDIPNYPVYLLVGQLVYSFFAESTNMAMSSILGGASLIKKVYLPKYIFPLSRVLSCFTTMIFSMIALFLVMFVTNTTFHLTLIMLPIVLVYILIFCIGMGLILSVLVVFFRDIQYIYHAVTTAWLYLTPIFYPLDQLSPKLTWMIKHFNPMYFYIGQFRDVVYYHQIPGPKIFTAGCIAAVVMMLIGTGTFFKNQDKFILYI